MRVLLASTRAHALPLLPFAGAWRDGGHEVLIAGPPPIGPLARGIDVAFHPVGGPDPVRLRRAQERLDGTSGLERLQLAAAELFVGAHGRGALPEMLRLVDAWRPDVIVRETAEVASLLAAEACGIPVIRVGVSLATPYEDWWLRMVADPLDALRAEIRVPADPGGGRAARTPLFTRVPAILDARRGDPPIAVRCYAIRALPPVTDAVADLEALVVPGAPRRRALA